MIAEAVQATLCQLDDGVKCRTTSGRYLKHLGNLVFHDELGQHVYPQDYDEPCETMKDWPHLHEGEGFQLLNKPKGFPHDILLFETDRGFRFRVRLVDYKICIPFQFNSTDERIGKGNGEWSARSGQIPPKLVGHPLCIMYDGNMPKLYIGFGHHMIIPKQ